MRRTSQQRALVLAVATTAVAFASLAGGPAPDEHEKKMTSARACGRCHEAAYETWRGSRHAAAFTNEIFQRDFARHRRAWCVTCHAPEASAPDVVASGARAGTGDGVSCVSCHRRDGLVLSAREPSSAGQSAHAMRREPDLATAASCARCHQFDVVDPYDAKEPGGAFAMQDTVKEHERSLYFSRGVTCQRCHMPEKSHAFPGGHDEELVKRSVSARVSRSGARELTAEVRSSGVGHRFPTGDPSRRLHVEVCADERCTQVLARGLLYREVRREAGRFVLVSDTTVPAPSEGIEPLVRLQLTLADVPRDGPLFWRLVYVLDVEGRVRRTLKSGRVAL